MATLALRNGNCQLSHSGVLLLFPTKHHAYTIHPFKVRNSWVFSIVSELCDITTVQFWNIFTPEETWHALGATPPTQQPLVQILCSALVMNVASSGRSSQGLAPSTQHALKAHPWAAVGQYCGMGRGTFQGPSMDCRSVCGLFIALG
jgi:hypothetical protein